MITYNSMVNPHELSRRGWLQAASLLAATGARGVAQENSSDTGPRTSTVEDRAKRLEWWHEARAPPPQVGISGCLRGLVAVVLATF
jgi:hypothetical protein